MAHFLDTTFISPPFFQVTPFCPNLNGPFPLIMGDASYLHGIQKRVQKVQNSGFPAVLPAISLLWP